MMNWEYWPMQAIYLPLMPVWFYYAIRSRSLFFFSASNPGIAFGGMGMESKMDIYKKMQRDLIPETVFIEQGLDQKQIETLLKNSGIAFPCIVKPDIGMKALAVEKIFSSETLLNYAKKLNRDFLIQELITFEQEIGVFYSRMPGHQSGVVTGVVYKEFLKVTGDGRHTLGELIMMNARSAFQWKFLEKKYGNKMQDVLPHEENLTLVPFGSHTRGAKFLDITNSVDQRLHEIIDKVCVNIDGFYFGRLDIRFESWESFLERHEFKIIEVNGAGSEPTHMYDPRHSLWFAWSEIAGHWKLLYETAKENHRRGHAYSSFSEGLWMIKQSKKLEKNLYQITS